MRTESESEANLLGAQRHRREVARKEFIVNEGWADAGQSIG